MEYASYEKLIKQELNKKGMIESSGTEVEYIIAIRYGIDGERQVFSSAPQFGLNESTSSTTTVTITSYGNVSTYSSATRRTPTDNFPAMEPTARKEFTRYLFLDITETAKSPNAKKSLVYEGKVLSFGESSQLAAVMPAMIKSIFEEFPGSSGKTRRSKQSF